MEMMDPTMDHLHYQLGVEGEEFSDFMASSGRPAIRCRSSLNGNCNHNQKIQDYLFPTGLFYFFLSTKRIMDRRINFEIIQLVREALSQHFLVMFVQPFSGKTQTRLGFCMELMNRHLNKKTPTSRCIANKKELVLKKHFSTLEAVASF